MFLKFNWHKIGWVVAIEAGIIIIIASFFLPGGDDLHRFYRPFSQGCLDCGFVPYFAQWLLWPLSLIPSALVWPVWTAISVIGFISLCGYTRVNPAIVILSFPAMGQFWLGQIDVIVAAGMVIGMLGSNPYLRGLGILLALVKPQLAGPAVLILLLHQSRPEIIKVLAIPLAAMLLSFWVYGLAWPLDWLANALANLPAHLWRLASNEFWPYGLVLMLLIGAFSPVEPRFKATLILSTLATPFFGVYSYVIYLIFLAPWCSLPLSYAWLLLYPFYGQNSIRFAWILPAGLLGYLLIKKDLSGLNLIGWEGVKLIPSPSSQPTTPIGAFVAQ